jgi:hypothetical protein
MSAKPKKHGVKALLELLGADPYESPPNNLEEARFRNELEGTPIEREELSRCPVNGKVSFTSEGQAKQAARARLNKGANTGRLRTYRCDYCSNFHVTSQFRK